MSDIFTNILGLFVAILAFPIFAFILGIIFVFIIGPILGMLIGAVVAVFISATLWRIFMKKFDE